MAGNGVASQSQPRVEPELEAQHQMGLGPIMRNSLTELEEATFSITEVLDQDSRPTFVIDLDPDDDNITAPGNRLSPVFCNSALRLHERLLDEVLGGNGAFDVAGPGLGPVGMISDGSDDKQTSYDEFRCWATSVTKFDKSKDVFPLSFIFRDMLWTGSTIRRRWRLISGNLLSTAATNHAPPPASVLESSDSNSKRAPPLLLRRGPFDRKSSFTQTEATLITVGTTLFSSSQQVLSSVSSRPPRIPPVNDRASAAPSDDPTNSSSNTRIHLATPDEAVVDWTVPKPSGALSPHVAFARTVKWEKTPLGPMEKWSPEFRQTVNLVMGNPHPAALFWGADLTMLYNEAYAAEVAGHKHPSLMGTGFSGPFSELWDAVSGIFAECARTGISIRKEDDYLPIHRHGFLEETFYSWSWTPLYGGTSRILGFYNAPFETTQSVLSHRRMKTISKLGENLSQAKTKKQCWAQIIESLQDNHYDVPFALLYSVGECEEGDEQSSVSSGSTLSSKTCYFEGSIGIPGGHMAIQKQLDLKRSCEGFIPSFREAMRTREPMLLHTRDGSLPEELLDGIQWRGYGDACNQAIIFPVRPTNGENVLAFLVVGINPRRPYDDGYKAFTLLLNRQLATSLASIILYEEEVRKGRDLAEAAAMEQEHLTQELALQTSRLRRMTELSPLGMYLVSPDGILREGNDRYFEMTGHPRDARYEMSWMEQIEEGSRKTMEEGWQRMIVDHQPWSGELQLKKLLVQPVDLHGEAIDYWVMATAQPEFATDGSIRSIMGSITDISHLKWAQGLQDRRLQEAEETRRQQNEFIDITSHEMRNPLSAVLQCADDILSTLEQHRSPDSPATPDAVEACVDAAQTISLCVQHQKAIVDDILTVSKLDSNLLVITPVLSHPVEVVRRSVKMFDKELQAKKIDMVLEQDASLQELGVEWAILDPSRVLQILINLITNAIKFTAGASRRTITVSTGASKELPPSVNIPDFRYIPPRSLNSNVAAGKDWGTGDVIYLNFRVSDTGVGLTQQEMEVLFERFSQASPRTHAQYGGSGLGLFISRQLAEMHGGQIGVASTDTSGSTFGFFITARRADGPLHTPKINSTPSTHQQDQDLLSSSGGMTSSPLLTTSTSTSTSTSPAHQSPSHPTSLPSTPLSGFSAQGLDILVVEDNLVNQMVLAKQLRKVGSRVSVANDGIEALAFLHQTHFVSRADGELDGADVVGAEGDLGDVVVKADAKKLFVILMDLEMPNMDGLTCVGEIRRMQRIGLIREHVPVIAVTANVRAEQVNTALESGMDDVVSKPFRIPDLMGKIEKLLSSKRTGPDGPGLL